LKGKIYATTKHCAILYTQNNTHRINEQGMELFITYKFCNFAFLLSRKFIKMNTEYVQINIPLRFKQVIDIVRQLSPSEKLQLSEALWSEQNIDDIVIPEEHQKIVRERIKK
jgi:hypothetical protein